MDTNHKQALELISAIKKENAKLDKFSDESIQKQRNRILTKITAFKVQLADLNMQAAERL